MNGPVDEHTALLADRAGDAYERTIRDGSHADLQEALSLMNEAVARARARRMAVLPGFLYNLSHLHHIRYRRDGDRDALGEAYGLLSEAHALMSSNDEITGRLQEIAQEQLHALNLNTQADAKWYVALHRRLVSHFDGDYGAWANLAVALRHLWPHTHNDADLRALAEACERVGAVVPHGSDVAVRSWVDAAQARLYLGAKERNATDAGRAAVAYEALGKHRPADASEREDELVLWALARVLAYELSGDADDRDAALAALRTLTGTLTELPTTLVSHAQHVLASLFPRYRLTRDTEVLNRASEFGIWCVARMDARHPNERSWDPGLLNSLGVFLAEHPSPGQPPSRPLPWTGWIPSSAERRRDWVADAPVLGLAEAFARRLPFHSKPGGVTAPTGKIYTEDKLPLVAVKWQPTRDSPLRGHAVTRFKSALVFPPQSGQGTGPVFVPARTHIVTITLTAPDRRPGIIQDVHVHVDACDPAYRETVDSILISENLPTPTLNVFLDFEPPLLWPSPTPLTIPQSTTQTLVVRAIAEGHDVRWRLELAWRCGRRTGTFTVPLRTTGESGWRSFSPEGELRHAPGYVISPDSASKRMS